jgi:Secretion system C-terminal sorting domain/SprB repeat
MSRFILLLPLICFSALGFAQSPQDLAVPVKISTGINPPAVLISWPNPVPSDVVLRRRVKGQAGNSWVELVNAPATLLDGYFDLGLAGDAVYEYEVELKRNGNAAYGYAFASFFTPVIDNRGKILVFIDSTTADQLGADLITFKNDLRGEGWQPVPFKTGPSTTVQWVKNKIVTAYNAEPNNIKAVLLLGSVPVPYAGSNAWDNKSDHTGAWPCDAFYGDVNGTWTDNAVNITNTARTANRNVPGDGKFDQNTLPSPVELPVGRIDFRRLSAATFGANPVELLRKYLIKSHLYKTGQYKAPNKALVDDHLGWAGGEAFAADGFRNAYPITGADQVVTGDFLAQTNPQRYLLGYAAGSAGTYNGATGIGNAAAMATDTIQVVFASLFGDYFGDWDFENNPYMPAVLASKGSVLACTWAGRPHFQQQALAAGETIGFCLKETQNAQYNTAYGQSNGESGAHIALLGDPTLRAQMPPSVTNLVANSNCNKVNLHWTAPQDSGILGYIVYRAFNQDGPYTRLTPDFVTQTSWDDTAPVADTLFYAVRTMKLEITPGGGAFYNTGTSPVQSVVFVPGTGPTAFGLGGTLSCAHPALTLGANFQPPTSTWQWYKPNGQPLSGFTATEAGVYTVIVTAPNSCTVAAYATVNIDTMLPVLNVPSVVQLTCQNPSFEVVIPAGTQWTTFTYNGTAVQPGTVISLTANAVFTVSASNNGCSKTYQVQVQQNSTPPTLQLLNNGLQLDCNHSSVVLTANATPSTVQYHWQGNGQEWSQQSWEVTDPGLYCVTVTGLNGCTAAACASVTESAGTFDLAIAYLDDPCANTAQTLVANPLGGAPPYTYLWSNGVTTATITLSVGFSGPVSVSVTDQLGCTSQAGVVFATPLSVLALTDKPTSGGANDGSIDLLVSGGQPPYNFLWSNGSVEEDISGLASNTYSVTVTGANGCSVVLVVPLITVATTFPASTPAVRVLPNPVQDQLQVLLEDAQVTQLQLLDVAGRVVHESGGTGAVFVLDTSGLPNGWYVLRVKTERGTRAVEVVVQH